MHFPSFQLRSLTLATILSISGVAYAVPTTLAGAGFDVVYDSAATGLFGAPVISGNNVYFSPTNFKAQSTGTQGSVTVSSSVGFDIVPHAGMAVTGTSLTEYGDYFLIGSGSSVSVGGQLSAYASVAPLTTVAATIAPAAPLTTMIGPMPSDWAATLALSFTSLAQLNATDFYHVTLLNTLIADNGANSANAAFIEKKFANMGLNVVVTPTTPAVPEPGQWAMFAAGLSLMGLIARRRKKN
jgi:PEP-CTERM motif